MSMKKILMTAVAVTALSAGAASAAIISNTTTIAAISLAPAGATITSNPYTIANEFVVTGSPTAAALLAVTPSSNLAVGQGQYVLTYNIAGGSGFTTTGVTTAKLALVIKDAAGVTIAVPTSAVNSVSTVSATAISFVVTVAAGEFLSSATFDNAIKLGTARDTISVSGTLKTATGIDVDGGTIASKTVVDYRNGYKFTATAADAQLTLTSAYKAFTAAATTATIGSAIKFGVNTGTDANDVVFSNAAGAAASTADIATAVLTLAGDVAAFSPTLNAQAVDLTTTNVFTADAGNLAALKAAGTTLVLNQKATPVAGNASAYSIAPVVTMGSATLTAPTLASAALGSVTLEGTNFYAAWIGDGSNGINYTIRLGNRTATAVAGITVTVLNSVNAVSPATCTIGTLPASGELLITSAKLATCFGSFGRADLRITAQATASNMTAKLRSVSAGVVNEQTLGGGTVDASAN